MDFTVSAELVGKYITNRQKDVDVLRELLNRKQYAVIANKAHNIKGNAASFGFPELGVVAQELEVAALEMRECKITQSISIMENWLESVLRI